MLQHLILFLTFRQVSFPLRYSWGYGLEEITSKRYFGFQTACFKISALFIFIAVNLHTFCMLLGHACCLLHTDTRITLMLPVEASFSRSALLGNILLLKKYFFPCLKTLFPLKAWSYQRISGSHTNYKLPCHGGKDMELEFDSQICKFWALRFWDRHVVVRPLGTGVSFWDSCLSNLYYKDWTGSHTNSIHYLILFY